MRFSLWVLYLSCYGSAKAQNDCYNALNIELLLYKKDSISLTNPLFQTPVRITNMGNRPVHLPGLWGGPEFFDDAFAPVVLRVFTASDTGGLTLVKPRIREIHQDANFIEPDSAMIPPGGSIVVYDVNFFFSTGIEQKGTYYIQPFLRLAHDALQQIIMGTEGHSHIEIPGTATRVVITD